MNRLSMRSPFAMLPALMGLLAVLASAPAHAFERGDHCTLQDPLPITIKTKRGSVEATIERGTDVRVTFAGEGGVTRIQAGETNGTVVTVDLEAACAGSLRLCTLRSPITMYEKNRSDSRSFKIKEGAALSELKRGKTWAAIRVGDLLGFVDTKEIGRACVSTGNDSVGVDETVDGDGAASDGPVEEVERSEGPGVLLLPFSLEGNAPAGVADAYFQTLWERTTFFRPDAGKVDDDGARRLPWKQFVDRSVARARSADMRYVVAGRLSLEPPGAEAAAAPPATVLQLGLYEVRTGKLLKGLRVKPSTRPGDPWADNVLAKLLPEVAAAPGSSVPATTGSLELPPPQAPATGPTGPAPASSTPAPKQSPWFANPLGYGALGIATVAGVGGGILGWFALSENTQANETPVTDEARASLRQGALTKGIAADALVAVAAICGVSAVILFATRAGLE